MPGVSPTPTHASTLAPVSAAPPVAVARASTPAVIAPQATVAATPTLTPRPAATVAPTPTLTPKPTATVAATPTLTPRPAATVIAPTPVVVLQLPNVADTVERVRPAVVSIVAEVVVTTLFGPRSSFGSGTGVIISPEGLVLTNNHVVEDTRKIIVTLDDGTQAEAKVVGADRLSDLAVLRLPDGSYDHLPLTRAVKLRVGEWVIAIGNALALPGGPTVTVGVVSALGRSIEASQGVTLYDLVQTDTVINPGNSGGPLLNLQGDLVGINTAVQRVTPSGAPVEGIGFAINTETASQVAEQLIAIGRVRWAWMGVILADLVPEVAAEVGLPVRQGVVIQNVVINSPSDRAGIQPGDIVLSAGGHKLATVSELTRLLKQEFRAGQEIEVELFREGARKKIRLLLGERPQQ